jgi:Cof subfamily protein (haloacid dehalogenase superfamily)
VRPIDSAPDPLNRTRASAAPIRLVAIDLDGTLLDDYKKISEPTVNALSCLRSDVKIVLATARPPRSVRHLYEQLGLDTFTINYNGALIWHEPQRTAVFHRPMAGELVHEIVTAARSLYADLLVSCEILDRWFTDRDDHTYTTETGRLFKPDVICPVDFICEQAVTKLMFLGHPELITALEPLIPSRFGDRVTSVRADADLLQVMDNRVSKATALRKVAGFYKVPMENVMAIGDAPNDVAMLQSAGVAVAVDNAHDRVKQVAHWVAPSNNDHGVHAALVRFGLCPV